MTTPSRRLLLAVLPCLPAFGLMLAGLGEPPHGEHVFRQTHVAGNIEKFLAHGLSLRPETYNQDVPGALFDFPLYPWLVTLLCRALGSPPVATARALNVGVLALTLAALFELWRRSGAGFAQRVFGLAFCAYAPLTLFYFQVPLPDPLALLLGLGSLLAYLRWDEAPAGSARGALVLLVSLGALSALIKNPLYLPFAVAIFYDRLRRRGVRSLVAPGLLVFAGALLVAVAGFKLYANHVNGVGAFLAAGEGEAYFGPLRDRLRPKFWRLIAASLTTRVQVPPCFWLALGGLALCASRCRWRARHLHVGLALGSLLALLVFFNRHREHAYYQLPFVPVCAFFAAYPLGLAAAWLRLRAGRSRAARPAGLALAALALAAAFGQGRAAYRAMSLDRDPALRERGAWIAANSAPDDFVVYVLGLREDNWEPSHLYFARRDGANLARTRLTYAALAGLQRRFASRYARFLLFCPAQGLEDADAPLVRLGARVLADDSSLGRLYRLEPTWLRPPD